MFTAGVVVLLTGVAVLVYIPNRMSWHWNMLGERWRPTEATVVKVISTST